MQKRLAAEVQSPLNTHDSEIPTQADVLILEFSLVSYLHSFCYLHSISQRYSFENSSQIVA